MNWLSVYKLAGRGRAVRMGGRLPVVGLMDARVLVRRVLHEGEPAGQGGKTSVK